MRCRWTVVRVHADILEPNDAVSIDDDHTGTNFHLLFCRFFKTESFGKHPLRISDHGKGNLIPCQLRSGNKILRFFYAFRVDENHLCIVFRKLTVLFAQLTQLLEAEWSPVADPTAMDNDKNILFAFEVRQTNRLAISILERVIRHRLPNLGNPLDLSPRAAGEYAGQCDRHQ